MQVEETFTEPMTPVVSRKNRKSRRKVTQTLFAGIHFVISSQMDNETREKLEMAIRTNSGTVIQNLSDYSENLQHRIILLAEGCQLSENYLFANLFDIVKLNIQYIEDCIKQNRMLPYEQYLLPRGSLNYQLIPQETYSEYILDPEDRVFGGVEIEYHVSDQLLAKLIQTSGARIVTQHTEIDTNGSKLIVFDGDTQSEMFNQLVQRANSLGICIVNRNYVTSCILKDEATSVLGVYSFNVADVIETVTEAVPDQNNNNTTDTWIHLTPDFIAGFIRATRVSSHQTKQQRFQLGDVVRLINKRIFKINNLHDSMDIKVMECQEFTGNGAKRQLASDNVVVPISEIESRVPMFLSKSDSKHSHICSREMLVQSGKLVYSGNRSMWKDAVTYSVIVEDGQEVKPQTVPIIEFKWLAPKAQYSSLGVIEYSGFLFQNSGYAVGEFIQLTTGTISDVYGKIKKLISTKEQSWKEATIEVRLFKHHPVQHPQLQNKCLTKTSDTCQFQLGDIHSISKLKISTQKMMQIKILRDDPKCFYIK
jgi:hypothetical protein